MSENKDFKKENNAIDKVEQIALTNETASPSDRKTGVKKALKKGEEKKKTNRQKGEAEREKQAKVKFAEKEEKRKKKEQIKKAKAQARKAKIAKKKKRREDIRAMRIAKKEERLARRDMLKHESKEEREKRIAAEKQAKLKAKARKAEIKAELKKAEKERRIEIKRQKQEAKHERKMQKAQAKERRGKEKRAKGVGGWLAAVISLGCGVLVLGSALSLSLFTDIMNRGGKTDDGMATERAFYDLVGCVDNIETNMSKLFVANDSESRQRILGDIMVQSNLADASLAALPVKDESKYYASKYINQVGDYAKYLNNRLIDRQKITDDDMERLVELYNINSDFKSALTSLSAMINEDYDFDLLKNNDANDMIIERFNEFESGAVDYPEMIYDGAFSDGVKSEEIKGLSGEKIDEIEAKKRFEEYFADYGAKDVSVTGKTANNKMVCYNVSGMTEDGELFAQISEIGGKLVMFNAYRECADEKYSEEECVEKATEFLNKIGFKNMRCVWSYSSSKTEHLNFAYTQDGIIMYPDLVKVNVCRETGKILGIDADNYFTNHTERLIGKVKHNIGEAFEKINVKLDVEEERVVVIPLGGGNETLAYEFIGSYNGSTYYIYVDAQTLKEVDIYKVVKTEQGTLLM